MMQNEKNPSDNTASSKNSTKTKKVEDNGVSKKQGMKFPFEDLKKQAEKKLNPDINYSDNNSETATANAQTSLSFNKNEALGEENKPKHNQTEGINMNENIDASTTDAASNNDKNANIEPSNDTMQESFSNKIESDEDDDFDDDITTEIDPDLVKLGVSDEEFKLDDDDNYDDDDDWYFDYLKSSESILDDEKKSVQAEANDKRNDITINTQREPLARESIIEDQKEKQGEIVQKTNSTEIQNKTVEVSKVKTNEQIEEETKRKEVETKYINKETEQIKSIEAQKQARREAIKNLFEATGGNIPKMFDEVNKELKALMKVDKKLELDNIDFSGDSALSAYRTPAFANSYKLDPTKDFYGMGIAEQDLLFERIGLFKGVVVDYSKENAIDQGYRNVVKFMNRPTDNNTAKPATEANRSKPVRVFYKKPRLSGFYETTYAFDEYQKKSQESGIFNLGFGLSASYNSGFVSAGVKAGYSYSKESLSETNTHIKEVSIISSFFLPKIELSFDTLQPCADDDLIAYLEKALANEKDTIACFDRINTILMSYGQFVPTSLVIGARLYSSDTKKIKQDESVENVLSKHEAEFKAAVSGMVVEAGIEAKMKAENSSKSTEKSTSEAQNVQFRAIGGEGAVIANMGKWVESTADAMYWGLIRFDNLVPVIDLLPYDLQTRMTDLFNRVVEECTIEDLLNKGAQFLFHKGYFERFGSKAQPKFCIIKNSLGAKQVLSVKINGELENNQEVFMSAYDGVGGDIQEWYFANSGKIYLKSNYDTENKFVLSIDSSRQASRLVITQDNYFDNQLWDARGGMIYNLSKKSYITYDGDKIQLEANKENAKNNTWLLVPEKDINAPSRRRIEAIVQKTTLMLSEGVSDTLDNNYFLPLEGTLKSQNGYAQLKFSADKIIIEWGKLQKEIWSYPISKSGAVKLGITNGTLAVLDEKDNILEGIATNVVDLRLMDSGNLEAIDKENNINWETNSIVYSSIQSDSTKLALSIMAQLNTDYKSISSQPYTGGDHQLWYFNRKKNIVSKFSENNKKFALTEIIVETHNPLFNPMLFTGEQAATIKNSHVELAIINSNYASQQQWRGLEPNNRGSVENQVSNNKLEKGAGYKPLCDPNELWVMAFDENAKKEANMPVVSFSRNEYNIIDQERLYKGWHKFAFNDINIKGKTIRAVCLTSEDDGNGYYKLCLKFKTIYGDILTSESLTPNVYVSNGLVVPNLSSAAYFSEDVSTISLQEYQLESNCYKLELKTKKDERITSYGYTYGVGDMVFVNPSVGWDEKTPKSICSDWVEVPSDHKAIGLAFTKVSDTMISPCLISVKR